MGIGVGETGVCPHCKIANRFEYATDRADYKVSSKSIENNGSFDILHICKCTNCKKVIIFFKEQMIYPLGAIRISAPVEVPEKIASDFNEACLIENLSSKASATLGRRCLQHILHDQGINKGNLSKEIDDVIKILPTYLGEDVDAIRNIGNFAAHPMKATNSGEILEVEPGETEWMLNVLEDLFDFYYVKPAISKNKKAQLNIKLQSVGKPNCK